MAVYDDQEPLSEEDQLRESLGETYNQSPGTTRQHIKNDESGADDEDTNQRRDLREGDEAADKADSEDVGNRVRAGYLKAQEQDAADAGGEGDKDSNPEGGGFYNQAKDKIKANAKSKGSSSKRNKILLGAAGGILTLGIGLIMSFGNFFAIFKLDHILQNIDAKSFSRFNASFSGRSDQYLKAYMKMRLNEIDNPNGTHDNLLFKADKVDTNNPIRDWYRTLRTRSFEQDLQSKTGIVFTSIKIEDSGTGAVTLRPARMTLNGEEIARLDPATSGLSPDSINKLKAGKLDSITLQELNGLGSKADDLISDTHIFDDSKTARKALKNDVKDATHFWNVLKRRHIRKDIQNKTGILSWRFFETTRDKITNKKIDIQQKILRKVLPDNKTGDFLKCILGAGKCVASTDSAAPENQLGSSPAGTTVDGDSTPTEEVSDADGNVSQTTDSDGNTVTKTTTDFGANEAAEDVTKTINNAVSSEVADGSEKIILSPAKKMITEQINKIIGGNIYTQAWSWAKKLAKIDYNITHNKYSKLVKVARLAQLSAIYTTYSIARDQAKTGQLTADEFGQVMETVSDVGQSEGWISQSNTESSNKVSAEAAKAETNANKTEYCDMNTTEQQANKIHYFCDSPGDSNAANLESSYRNSIVGKIIGPIAEAVRDVENSVLGTVFDAITNVANVFNKVLDPVISGVLKVTGIEGEISKIMGFAITKVMTFLGAGPIFDGTPNTGAANFIMAGSAATAEASTRDSGGVKSTPKTIAYTTKLAANYEKDQKDSQSLFDRYASLSNTQSVFSSALFSVANFNVSTSLSHLFGWLGTIPKTVGSLVNGNAFATTNDFNTATWAGVDTYDIPPACQGSNLDPLDTDYLTKAVGVVDDSPHASEAQSIVDGIRSSLNYANETDSAQFWKLVYDKIGNNDKQEEIAGAIYNCALFDQRVMSGLGYTSGYTNDGGLDSGANGSGSNVLAPGDVSCTSYATMPGSKSVLYDSAAAGQCNKVKSMCTSGISYSGKLICGALPFTGVYYANGNKDSTYNQPGGQGQQLYGIVTKGGYGHPPASWLQQRSYPAYNFIDCSGLVNVANYTAYGVNENRCSAGYLSSPNFNKLPDLNNLQSGDILIENDVCGNDGHIGIVAGVEPDGTVITFEARGGGAPVGFVNRGKIGSSFIFKYAMRHKDQ